jgi:hypothetical protein
MHATGTLVLSISFLACAIAGCARSESQTPPAREPESQTAAQSEFPDVASVRALLCLATRKCDIDCTEPYEAELIKLGDRAFPAYEAILADSKSDLDQLTTTYRIISKLKVDRRRFIPFATQRFSEPNGLIHLDKEVQVHGSPLDQQAGTQAEMSHWIQAAVLYATNLARVRSDARAAAVYFLGKIGDERDSLPLVPLLSDGSNRVRHAAATTLARIGSKRDLEAMDKWLKDGKHPNDADHMIHVKKCRDELEKRLKENPVPKNIIN